MVMCFAFYNFCLSHCIPAADSFRSVYLFVDSSLHSVFIWLKKKTCCFFCVYVCVCVCCLCWDRFVVFFLVFKLEITLFKQKAGVPDIGKKVFCVFDFFSYIFFFLV